jgi:hypothetical protein
MDRVSTLPVSAARNLRLKNLAASSAVTALACAAYGFTPHGRRQLDELYGFAGFSIVGRDFLVTAALWYMALLLVYYLAERNPRSSKSLLFFRVVGRFVRSPSTEWAKGLSREDRVAVLVTLLKAFFAPLMVMSLMVFFMGAVTNGAGIAEGGAFAAGFRTLFDRHGFWFLIQLILFVDVLIFTVGYLVELPQLHNEIRSVDPTLMGWGAALVCYPPFNTVTSAVLGSPVSDFPRFDDPTAHVSLNLALLTLMAIYASASVALGFKASNLTHRGIVARGPYAVIRHPAYLCKNLAWWIGSIPLVSTAFGQSWFGGVQAVASVVGWSMIYVLRALTEEDHLRGVDGEYAAYAATVRYRFIPGIV